MSDNLLLDIKDGISQSERLFGALMPDNFQIDARDIPDFLNFIAGLAEHFTYYNFSNEPEGDWRDFFNSEEEVLVAMISRFDLSNQFKTYHDYISAISTCDEDDQLVLLLKKIFDCLFGILESLMVFKKQFGKKQRPVEITNLLLLVKDIDFEIARLTRYNKEAIQHFGNQVESGSHLVVDTVDDDDNAIFEMDKKDAAPQAGANTVKQKIKNAIPHLTTLLNYTQAKYNHLVKAAQYHLKQNDVLENTYTPHISLLIAFLNLYQQHLRPSINGLTKRHLDFYFKDLLGIASSKAKPDVVNLLFEPEQGINSIVLEEGEKLIALKPGKQEPLIYQLEHPVQITKTKIGELKTIFISDYTQIISKDAELEDIKEVQVYKYDNPLFDAKAYQKKTIELKSWPILGEDQHNLAFNLRTMEDSEIGLLLGSPLFYQPEGERTFKINIQFKADSFQTFKSYVKNYGLVARKREETVLNQLLSHAFFIQYTTIDGWEDVPNYAIKYHDTIIQGNSLEIEFLLHSIAKPMSMYQSLVHGNDYESTFPILKILINNYSPNNPYSFLKDTLIERISIELDVKNFSGLKLQNNNSVLSPAVPFQPFGPQPSVGSFLDIKNTNVFNRYTKDFSINIEWLDLPRNDDGFESYYKTYRGNITNESFLVGMSAWEGSRFKPNPDNQQHFHLFETQKHNRLKNKTKLSNIDLKKIEFLNAPALAGEEDFSDGNFKEGVIRLELVAPSEAFGHKQFPQLFPETVMNNARFFKKKKPLPNQPYIPVMKAISIDFTLEHSENFNDSSNESQNNILLIHQYPFGYHTIYPYNSKKSYFLMPQFQDDSNLFIGLKEAEPNQEISFLFQLEEKNFHHTLHEPDPVTWSYLTDNTWQDLDPIHVLNDGTNNFVNSGIIRLKMPSEIPLEHTLLNSGLFWLRAAVHRSCGTQSKVIGISVNAGTAIRKQDGTIEKETDFNLPPGCITGFTRNVKGIQAIRQLFPSFDGRPHETQEKYYVRVSERLRHKYRIVQIRDVMQVILEEFPQIYMVKCFGIGAQDTLILPGVNLQVVLIPKDSGTGRFRNEQPKVNLATLYQVKTFLTNLISPFVKIEVGNAVYEKVKVICSVMFLDNKIADQGYYSKKLIDDINRYISPWLFDTDSEIKIGAKLFKSDLFMLIKNLPYVTYVTGFSIVHLYNSKTDDTIDFSAYMDDTAIDIMDYVKGSNPSSVLIPSANHLIKVIDKPDYSPPAQTGINGFTIGEELLVTEKHHNNQKDHSSADTKARKTFNLIIPHDIE